MIIIDAHEDLAFNALVDGRDYLQSAYVTRAAEEGEPAPEDVGICMLGLPEWLQAQVAIIFATLTTIPRALAHPGELSYRNSEASHQQALAQLAIYRRWAATSPSIRLITYHSHLDETLATWERWRVSAGRPGAAHGERRLHSDEPMKLASGTNKDCGSLAPPGIAIGSREAPWTAGPLTAAGARPVGRDGAPGDGAGPEPYV